MNRKIAVSLCLIWLIVYNGHAQSPSNTIDSLKILIGSAKHDIHKVKLLLALGDAYKEKTSDYPTAKYYYRQAGAISRDLQYYRGMVAYLFDYSDALVQQGKYDSALVMSKEALSVATGEKDSASMVRALFDIGVSYSGSGNLTRAIHYFLLAKDYYENKKMMEMVGRCANELMLLFYQSKQYSQAIAYGKEAVTLQRKYSSPEKVAIPLQNLSVAYQAVGRTKKAGSLLKEALAIDLKYHRLYDELVVLINLVDLKFRSNELGDIKPQIDRILLLSEKMKIDEGLCAGKFDLSQFYLWQNKRTIAEAYADSALQIAERIKSDVKKRECLVLLSHIAYADHQFVKALKYDEQIDLTQDAINTANINHSLIELQTKYETAKKAAQIKHLQTQQELQKLSIQKKRIYIAIMIVIIVALIIIGILYYLNHKRKNNLLLTEQKLHQQRIAALEQEKQLLATEAILKGQDEERQRLAKDLHDGLGGILSSAKYSLNDMRENLIITADNASAFDRTMGILDKSITELRRVAHNMMPESLMNQSLSEALLDACNQVSASGALHVDFIEFGMNDVHLDNSVRVAVYRVVQELLNNIIKHAQAASAIVQIIAGDGMLHITVEDKGSGFDKSTLTDAKGIGYKNVRNRIDYLKGKIDIRSEDQQGTSVYIEIPL